MAAFAAHESLNCSDKFKKNASLNFDYYRQVAYCKLKNNKMVNIHQVLQILHF